MFNIEQTPSRPANIVVLLATGDWRQIYESKPDQPDDTGRSPLRASTSSLDGLEAVFFKPFLDELCREYSSMLTSEGHGRTIVVEGCDARMPAATAIPLSLIVNEFITNAAKHGRGIIAVRLGEMPEGGHLLSVCNEGPSPTEGFDPTASNWLGMQIVEGLVGQIVAKLLIDRCERIGGLRFAVAFA